jgi:hypothetical protein
MSQMPNLISKLTNELDYEGERLIQSPVNRPVIRIIGNLFTIESIPQDLLDNELISNDRFQTFIMSVLLNDSQGLLTVGQS